MLDALTTKIKSLLLRARAFFFRTLLFYPDRVSRATMMALRSKRIAACLQEQGVQSELFGQPSHDTPSAFNGTSSIIRCSSVGALIILESPAMMHMVAIWGEQHLVVYVKESSFTRTHETAHEHYSRELMHASSSRKK